MPLDNIPVQGKSLFRRLIFWFLLFSLLPVSITSWLNYQQAEHSLIKAAEDKLYQDSDLNDQFINNWFDYRLMDIKNQTLLKMNVQLLKTLSDTFAKSQLSLIDYVKSPQYMALTEEQGQNLFDLKESYDYLFDILLIDKKGNILFSTRSENGLGENLNAISLFESKLSNAVFTSMKMGEVEFSDLQYYGGKERKLS